MSWAEKKSSAEASFRQDDFEKAMYGYAAAAVAASFQKAATRDIAKCFSNASQMAWKALIQFINSSYDKEKMINQTDEEEIRNKEIKNRFIHDTFRFAENAVRYDNSWIKGSAYLLRSMAFQYKNCKEDRFLQEAKKLSNKILTHHFNVPLSKIKNDAIWLGLYLIKHPCYTKFITQCPGFDAVKFPEEAIYISPTEAACFKSFEDAQKFLRVLCCIENLESKGYSFLLSPGKYLIEADIDFVELVVDIRDIVVDIVGNRCHKLLGNLKEDGMKILEDGSATSDSVVLEFVGNSNSDRVFSAVFLSTRLRRPVFKHNFLTNSFGFFATRSGFSLSRLSIIDRSKMDFNIITCDLSEVHVSNCFFGSEFKDNFKSDFLFSSKSSVSLEDCVLSQAACAARLKDSKAVLKNCIIESSGWGINTYSSQVEIENAHFNCHLCIQCKDGSEVRIKKSVFQEEPHHYSKHAMAVSTPLIEACKSTLSIEDSVIGSDFFESDSSSKIRVVNSKFVLKNCQLILKDSWHVIEASEGSNAMIENNVFHFKNQRTKKLSLVILGKTDFLELCGNVVQDLDEILEQGIQVFDIIMPQDGITPKFSGIPKIKRVSGDVVEDKAKVTDDFKHVSVHYDRLRSEGSKKSKAGKRLCHSCSKVEPEEEKSFHYCGQCKIVSYCSKKCQTKNWKKEHKNWCNFHFKDSS